MGVAALQVLDVALAEEGAVAANTVAHEADVVRAAAHQGEAPRHVAPLALRAVDPAEVQHVAALEGPQDAHQALAVQLLQARV